MQVLPRELQAVDGFTRAAFQFVGMLEDEHLRRFAAQLSDGVTVTAESELYARQVERCEALGVQRGRGEFCQQRFGELNERGRRIIQASTARLTELREAFKSQYPKDKRVAPAQVNEWRDRIYTLLSELDLKGSDAKELKGIVDQYAEIMTKKGPAEVLALLEQNVNELYRVRGESGRGATTNLPIWKAIAIAAFMGVGLWAIFKCGFFGCTINENLAYGTIMTIAALVSWFC